MEPQQPVRASRNVPPRTLAIIAIGAIIGGLLLGAVVRMIPGSATPSSIAVVPSPSPSSTLAASAAPSAAHPTSALAPTPAPTPTPTPTDATSSAEPVIAAKLPVKGDGRELGTGILMAPGPGGGLYVLIPGRNGGVVALLGKTGQPRSGWPVLLAGLDGCDLLLPVADGSVRVVCSVPPTDDGLDSTVRRAFAFGPNGRALSGWPVDVGDAFAGRMIDGELTMLETPYLGDTPAADVMRMLIIRPDGSVQRGADVSRVCCDGAWVVGPDRIAYGTNHRDWSSTDLAVVKTDVMAFGFDGPRAGWPVTIDGNASGLEFDAHGRVYLVVGSPAARPARTVVFDQDGHLLASGSGDQAIASTNTWDGAGGEFAGSPVVANNGTAFIISTQGGSTTIVALDPAGKPLSGWPYRSKVGMEWTGFCGDGDTGCGHVRTMPGVGSGNLLYLFRAASSPSVGGSMVAIRSDGSVRDGWPLGLKRAGSMFWSMAVAPDGGVWALAIEPETRGYSATILAIADDSTVLYSTTIVEP